MTILQLQGCSYSVRDASAAPAHLRSRRHPDRLLDDICNAVNATLAHLGKPELPHEVVASYIGDGAAMLLRRALGDPGDLDSSCIDDSVLNKALGYFIRYYRLHKLDNTVLYEGVRESLEAIHSARQDILMAVLTNKPVGPSREICRLLGIEPFFFQNYGGDSFSTKKPDPQGFLQLIADANILLAERAESDLERAEVVMIGDSAVDVLTARNCGARCIGCTFGLDRDKLVAAKPDYVVAHASEWPAVLDRMTRC